MFAGAFFVQAATCNSPSRNGSDKDEECSVSFTRPHTNSSLSSCSTSKTTYSVCVQTRGWYCQDKKDDITDIKYYSGNKAYLSPSVDYCGKCSNGKCESCPLACDSPVWSCSKNTCPANYCGSIDDGCGGTISCNTCTVGSCGTINTTNQTWPSSGTWCGSGTMSDWTQRGDQSNSNLWKWSCNGSGTGATNASCSFTQQCGVGQVLSNGYCISSVVNGLCGTISGTNQTWPSSGTWCGSGTMSDWTQRGDQSNGNVWIWSCNGSGGGSNAFPCSFTQQCGVGYSLQNGTCVGNSCTGPDGVTIQSGSSKTYYKTPISGTCSAQTEVRTCTAGVLSGTAQYTSCANSCTGPDGALILNGASKTYYKDSVSTACSSKSEVRTCTNGTLSSSSNNYINSSCVNSTLSLALKPAVSNGRCTLVYSLTNYPVSYDPNSSCYLSSVPAITLPALSFNSGNGTVKNGTTTISSVVNTTTFSLSCTGTDIATATAKCIVPKYSEF